MLYNGLDEYMGLGAFITTSNPIVVPTAAPTSTNWLTNATNTLNKATSFINTNVAPIVSNVKSTIQTVKANPTFPGSTAPGSTLPGGGGAAQPSFLQAHGKKIAIGLGLAALGYAGYKFATKKKGK